MPIQVYRCEKHGEFEVAYNISAKVLRRAACPYNSNTIEVCALPSIWVPQVISFSVNGGTGAQRKSQ